MRRLRRLRHPLGWAVVLLLLPAAGCLGPAEPPTEEGTTRTSQTPFHSGGAEQVSSGNASGPAQRKGITPENNLPFRYSQYVPAGTLLMIRLSGPLSAQDPGAHDSFNGVLDEPVVLDGNTLIPRGSAVTGHVESFRMSRMKPDRGYIQLKLESIHVAGLDTPVQTASLFVRQTGHDAVSSAVIRLDKGHRLTFRLAEPLYLSTQKAQATP